MRKLIPIECSKIINMFSFKKQKLKVTFLDMNRKQ